MLFLGRRHRNALLGLLLAFIVVVSFCSSVGVTRMDAPWAYFSLATRAWELAMGALVALGASQLARLPGSIAVAGAWLAINQALRKLGGVTLADPAGWICASKVCPAVVGNLLVFRDAQHLSADFSEWLTPMITSLLNKLKPGRAG
jgi:peptidoglycan/LPS O-acetylase OafA/YrhL